MATVTTSRPAVNSSAPTCPECGKVLEFPFGRTEGEKDGFCQQHGWLCDDIEENNMTVCEQFREWAREAVEEWDGQDTAELFAAILAKTGEHKGPILSRVVLAPEDGRVTARKER